jgi:eukaryotic-like serine/threonine-protein kinase
MVDRVGPYDLYEPLASGGMAEIFVAKKTGPGGFDKPLVIKRIHKKLLGDKEIEAMFVDEARVQALLDHPNIVQIYDFGEDKGAYFIAMEFIHGATLRWVIDNANAVQRPLPLAISLRIVADVLVGLHAAHEQRDANGQPLRLIHRDISPVNILVGRTGHPKLCDFGVAKSELQRVMTRAGIVKGKFRYMSPEQLNGEPLDCRADLFAVGCVLWEMVVGRRLFDHVDEDDVVDAIRGANFPVPSEVKPGVSTDVDRLLRRACHPNRDKRFRSAREFSRACELLLRAQPDGASVADVADYVSAELDGLADLYADKKANEQYSVAGRPRPQMNAPGGDLFSLGFDRLDPPVPNGPTVIRARADLLDASQRHADPWQANASGAVGVAAIGSAGIMAKMLTGMVLVPAWMMSWPGRVVERLLTRKSNPAVPGVRVTRV